MNEVNMDSTSQSLSPDALAMGAEADWFIDLDKLVAESGDSPLSSDTPQPSSPNPALGIVTGSEFFRLADVPAVNPAVHFAHLTETPAVAHPTADPQSGNTEIVTIPPEEADAGYVALREQNLHLQQQNEQLLTWVSELEESLNQCQSALQFQRQRSQELEILISQRQQPAFPSPDRSELAALEESLQRTLQESQQHLQKHQILVDTLTLQLENTKERVVTVEQDYVNLQKRFAEQTQRLVQSENECRALKTRLSRQQRYTLQFKAALERCLEVSVPLPSDIPLTKEELSLEGTSPALPEPVTFFPRSSPVQPWTGGETPEVEGSWSKVAQWVDDAPVLESQDLAATCGTLEPVVLEPIALDPQQPISQLLSETVSQPVDSGADATLEPLAERSETEASENSSLSSPLAWGSPAVVFMGESPTPARSAPPRSLPPQSVVSPDLSSEYSSPVFDRSSDLSPVPLPDASVTPTEDPLDLDAAQLDQALQAVMNQPQIAPPVDTVGAAQEISPDPYQSLSQQPYQAEQSYQAQQPYQLWQTLAQSEPAPQPSRSPQSVNPLNGGQSPMLPEVPLSADRSRADRINIATPNSNPIAPPVTSEPSLPTYTTHTAPTIAPNRVLPPEIQEDPAEEPSPRPVATNPLLNPPPSLNLQPSWPSPIVHPLRPLKKRESLAAIELPTFPRPSV